MLHEQRNAKISSSILSSRPQKFFFVVPANHKKLPIRKIKLPQNVHATRYFDLFCIQMKPMHQSCQILCKKPVFENLFNVTCEQCRFSSVPSERAFARKRTEQNAVGPRYHGRWIDSI